MPIGLALVFMHAGLCRVETGIERDRHREALRHGAGKKRKEKGSVDQAAAVAILNAYLEARARELAGRVARQLLHQLQRARQEAVAANTAPVDQPRAQPAAAIGRKNGSTMAGACSGAVGTSGASRPSPRHTAQAARGNTVSRVPIRWIVSWSERCSTFWAPG